MKRFISILLAAMLVISMLPTAFADSTTTYEYILNWDSIPGVPCSGNQPSMKEIADWTGYPTMGNNGSQPWALANYSIEGNITAGDKGRLMFSAKPGTADLGAMFAWAVLKIKVPAAGIYNLDVYAADQANAAGVNVHLFACGDITKLDASNLTDENKIGHFDAYAEGVNGNTFTERDMGSVYIEAAGEYYIGFGLTASGHPNGKSKENAYISKITLTETPATSVVLDKESVALKVGGESELSAVVSGASGTLSVAKVTYTSSAPTIAAVDANTGKITAVAPGDATITAKVAGYPDVIATAEVNVAEAERIVSATYKFTSKVLNPENTGVVRYKTEYSLPGEYYSTFDAKESDKWAFVTVGDFNVAYANTDRSLFNLPKSGLGAVAAERVGVIFKIEVPETGKYKSEISTYTRSLNGQPGLEVDVYLMNTKTGGLAGFDADHNGTIDSNQALNVLPRVKEEHLAGSFDNDDGTNSNAKVNELENELNLEKGEYYLIFKVMGYNEEKLATLADNTTCGFGVNSFTITKTGNYTPNTRNDISPTVSFCADANIDDAQIISSIEYTQGTIINPDRGTEITLTAPEVSGYVFRGWIRGTEKDGLDNYVTKENECDIKIATNTYLTAVYDREDNPVEENTKVVEFWNQDGSYCTKMVAGENGKLTFLPVGPELIGFTFDKWRIQEEIELTTDTYLEEATTRAVAKQDENTVSGITFMGEAVGDKKYGEEINLSAPAGETKASYWLRDGKIVDYGSSYTYFAWDATAITYGTGPILMEPVVFLDDYANGAFMLEYDVYSAGFDIVEVGILLSNKENIDVDHCLKKVTSQRSDSHGQISVAVDEGTYARGYMIYEESGTYRVIYSDNVAKAE